MKRLSISTIQAVTIQVVGNKTLGEGISYAGQLTVLGQSEEFIKEMIDKNFDFVNQKHFTYIESIDLNPTYNFIKKIFSNPECFLKQSNNLAAYLYEQSIHPNVKCGEFYVILATCLYLGTKHECVILLKNERKEAFLSYENIGSVINVRTNYGVGIKNLDKGCIVINLDAEKGYVVFTLDKTNNGSDAHYWIDSFLHVEDAEDDRYNNSMKLVEVCASFVRELRKTENDIECAKTATAIEHLFSSGININQQTLIDQVCQMEPHKHLLEDLLKDAGVGYESLVEGIHPNVTAIKRRKLTKFNTLRLGDDFELKVLNPDAKIVTGEDPDTGLRCTSLYYK